MKLKQLCIEIKYKFGENNVYMNQEKDCFDTTLDFSSLETTSLKESYWYRDPPVSLNGRILRWYINENLFPCTTECSNVHIEAAILECKSGKKSSVTHYYSTAVNENFIKAKLLVDIGSITWELITEEIRATSYR